MADSGGLLDDIDRLFEEVGNSFRTDDSAFAQDREEIDEYSVREPRRNRFVDIIGQCNLRRRICHDILPVRDLDHGIEYANNVRSKRYYGQLIIVSYHGSNSDWQHLHIVHDCSWTAGTCRCSCFAGFPFAPRRRRAVWTGGVGRGEIIFLYNHVLYKIIISLEYFEHLGVYLFVHPRQCLYHFIAGSRGEILGADEVNTIQGSEDGAQGATVDEDDEICAVYRDTVDAGPIPAPHSFNRGRQKRHTKPRANQSQKEIEEILEFFKKYPVCPLLSSCKTVQWLDNSILKGIGRSDSNFHLAIDIFQREICNKSINELIEFYLQCTPLFGCTSGHIYDYYYSIEESTDKLNNLLLFQHNNDTENVHSFLKILYNVLDKRVEKKNCIQIRGHSNAGKTIMAKVCASLCLVKGQITNFNKYNQFPLQDCVDKRILIWDEPNCEPAAFETCKLLFAGDPAMANIKYQTHVQIDKTPIMITTNTEVFPNNEIFNNRMYKYDWYTAPLLKGYTKHIHPLALYELWKIYNVIQT